MQQSYEIVNAEREDLERIVAIYNTTIASRSVTADLEPVTTEDRIGWFEAHSADKWPIWVMKDGEAIIAWLSFSRFHSRAAYDATAEISIYIDLAYRSKGIGSLFFRKAIEECPRLGIRNVLAIVFGHNEASLALLRKFGFEQWGLLPGVTTLDGVDRDVVYMGLKVPTQ
ncbi:GNAT family N-acetyltransferase [Cohnella cellulosilytica]|uniref:GNAT family N-acetyltransferase n=1 Tax=Cohnella cellulosilytica TaxID=986710 RepID=A0ABW2FNY5_9BACL